MTGSVANAVFLRSRAGKEEELAGRLEELVLASRSDPGVMIYDLHRSIADPALWFLYERYESQEHLNRHRAGPPPFRCGHRDTSGGEARCSNVRGDCRFARRLKVAFAKSIERHALGRK
jgi:quinol monooxygenase YgiN